MSSIADDVAQRQREREAGAKAQREEATQTQPFMPQTVRSKPHRTLS